MKSNSKTNALIHTLHRFLVDNYSLDELRTLCFGIGVEFENLAGPDTREAKARELLLTIGRQNQLDLLLKYLEETRPTTFEQRGLKNNTAFLDRLYSELEVFEENTRSVQEKLLARLRQGQLLGFLLVITLFIALYFLLRPQMPSTMSGHFRIAVAEFEEIGDSGKSQIGRVLADDAFLQLQKSLDALDLGFVITIWGPEQVGEVNGRSSEERAFAAASLADRINAHMIIYGAVDISEDGWFALPEFYIAETNFYQAEEITGQHQLGRPFPIAGQGNIAGLIKASNEMTLRTRVLSQIVIGLSFYAIEDYTKASEAYLLIDDIEGWDDKGNYPIIPLLLGNAAVKNDALEAAVSYYQQSVLLDPEYARGYLGVSNLYYRQALLPFEESKNPQDIDQALLSLALQTLETAETAQNQSSSADIGIKIHFERGQIYLSQAISGQLDSYDAAVQEFNAVIDGYANGANPRVIELAAESYARLGLINALNDNTEIAVEEYMKASSMTSNPTRQSIFATRIVELADQ